MRLTLYFIAILFSITAFAQNTVEPGQAKSFIFIEAGGVGGYGSLNYERKAVRFGRFDLDLRVGLSTYHIKDFTNSFNPDITVPLVISALYGRNHHIELGAGQVYSSCVYFDGESGKAERQLRSNHNVFIGYRYAKESGGFMYRITYSPLFTEDVRWDWAGVSIGYAF